jgi:predicted kinase
VTTERERRNAGRTVTATLHLLCGKIAAGKSTLARALAAQPSTVLISLDDWLSSLYPTENNSLEDFVRLTGRLRSVMGPHVAAVLRQGVSVVLDFPANTKAWREWMRSIIDRAGVAHELHVLDVPDALCKARLRQRNASGEHPYELDDATYELFTRHFVPPSADEGFHLVIHSA